MSFGTIHVGDVTISLGNEKMGLIPSVSLPPVVTCPAGVPCARECYAVGMCARCPSVRASYARNLEALKDNPAAYFAAVADVASMARAFRWHVSGDITSPEYFRGMVAAAQLCPSTRFLAFTKAYNVVNDYLDEVGELPSNLTVIFSHWDDHVYPMHNPYHLPTALVVYPWEDVPTGEGYHLCNGDCSHCARTRTGCYGVDRGDTVVLLWHGTSKARSAMLKAHKAQIEAAGGLKR